MVYSSNRKNHEKNWLVQREDLRAPQQRQHPCFIFPLPPSAGGKPSELINEACDLLQLIFSFCKACAQRVTLEQTLKSRETFHVVKAKGVLKCSAWLICAPCCRAEFQHAQFIKVRGGRFRNKSCCTFGSVSVLLSTNLIPTMRCFFYHGRVHFCECFVTITGRASEIRTIKNRQTVNALRVEVKKIIFPQLQ